MIIKPTIFTSIFFTIIVLSSKSSFATNQETTGDRKSIANEKSRKFERSDRVRQYAALSGYRDSDYNSHDYNLSGRYSYQSKNNVSYIRFRHESKYKIQTKVIRGLPTKYSELYDATLSHKLRILDQQNYIALYHRTQYDDMSEYYYDLRSAAGFGRFFMDQDIQLDLSVGYRDVKNYGYNMNVVPSFRIRFNLTDKLEFVQRGFLFIDHKSMDSELISKLIYDVNSQISLQLIHDFDKKRYEDISKKNPTINRVDRRTTIGIIYRF